MSPTDLYDKVSYGSARRLTLQYSSSFGLASRLFDSSVRKHIYAIYGMVRVADEIVDTYNGPDKTALLNSFHAEVLSAVQKGYSTNPIVHAFALTAQTFHIDSTLIDPFFKSMTTDVSKTRFTKPEYDEYVYGSAEVIGLMCLRVFCAGDDSEYKRLAPGAKQLGSAYQKINFLRDFGADYEERGRIYFPGVTYESWAEDQKQAIIDDIATEFESARHAIHQLPASARTSVYLSYVYYQRLLQKLSRMSAQQIKIQRAHVPTITKLLLLLTSAIGARLA